jgi:hypothetical protein
MRATGAFECAVRQAIDGAECHGQIATIDRGRDQQQREEIRAMLAERQCGELATASETEQTDEQYLQHRPIGTRCQQAE